MLLVKWPRLLVWHIARVDATTVCGLPTSASLHALGRRKRNLRVCRSCERMARAMRPVLA